MSMRTALLGSMVVILAMATGRTADADSPPYTYEYLDSRSRGELIAIIFQLQEMCVADDDLACTEVSFDAAASDASGNYDGAVLTKVQHSGYTDHGSLRWPDGSTFFHRNSGYTDDRSLFYPGGELLVRRNPGYTDDRTLYWPNGQVMRLRNPGYTNDGTIYRPDGSIWLKRNIGYSDDRQRYGLPTHTFEQGGITAKFHLTAADSVEGTIEVTGQGWSVRLDVDGATSTVTSLAECLP